MKTVLKVLFFTALATFMAGCTAYRTTDVVTPVAVPVPVGVVGQSPSDNMITNKVTAKYLRDAKLRSYGINVSTRRGVVVLAGQVPSARLKHRAVRIAMSTPGVRAVDAQNLSTPMMSTMQPQPMGVARPHRKRRRAAMMPTTTSTSTPTVMPTTGSATTSRTSGT